MLSICDIICIFNQLGIRSICLNCLSFALLLYVLYFIPCFKLFSIHFEVIKNVLYTNACFPRKIVIISPISNFNSTLIMLISMFFKKMCVFFNAFLNTINCSFFDVVRACCLALIHLTFMPTVKYTPHVHFKTILFCPNYNK